MWYNVVAICVKKTSVVPAGTCLQLRCWWIITRVWRVKWKLEAGAPWSVSRWAKHCWLLETQQLKRWDEKYYNHYKHCFIVCTTCPLQNSCITQDGAGETKCLKANLWSAKSAFYCTLYSALCLWQIKIFEPWTLCWLLTIHLHHIFPILIKNLLIRMT